MEGTREDPVEGTREDPIEGPREDPFSAEPDPINGADEFAALASRLPLDELPSDEPSEPSILNEDITVTDTTEEEKPDWNAFAQPTVVQELQQSNEIGEGLTGVQEGDEGENKQEEPEYDEAKNVPDVEDKDPVADELDDSGQIASASNSIVGDVLYSIATGEEEGRSRQRMLAFAAKRYENAVQRNPKDYDALYNWALVLQESADNTGPDSGGEARDRLLEEACKKYATATQLCPTLQEAYYNWAIAISDRAKIRGRREEAQNLWRQACEKYERAVQLNWDSPQALNNWGLALQELGTIVPLREKAAIVKKAISKFRAAIRLRFDFHRAVYNLGTVLYGRAEDILRSGRKGDGKNLTPQSVYAQSAVYICAAHALKPDYPVYVSALRLVRKMLPLPFLKSGLLLTPPPSGALTPHDTWTKRWFVLDHEALFEKPNERPDPPRHSMTSGHSHDDEMDLERTLRVDLGSIVSVAPSSDFSLPAGGGFRIEIYGSPALYLVAETWDVMDGWVDAIRLAYTISVRGKQDALMGVLRS